MKRWLALLAIVGTWAACGVQTASAQLGSYQPPQVSPGPSFSPYLNMIRNNPAVNYFGIVQPQMSTTGTLQQMQQDIRFGQTGNMSQYGMTSQAMNNNQMTTGHPIMFGYTAQYFPMGNQMAGMGMGMGMGTGMGMGGGMGAGVGGFGTGIGAGMGMGGIGGAGPTINSPLPQGYILPR